MQKLFSLIATVLLIASCSSGSGTTAPPTGPEPVALSIPTDTDITANSVVLTWSVSTAGDFSLYAIVMESASDSVLAAISDRNTTQYEVQDLQPDTEYQFRVDVRSTANQTGKGSTIAVTTDSECGIDFRFNDTWQNVIYNLEGALICGDATEYLDVLSGDFVYEPTAFLMAQYPTVFDTVWTKDRESNFIQNAFTGSLFQASLADSILSGPTLCGDQIDLTVRYIINEVEAAGTPTGRSWKGIADYKFRLGSLVTMILWKDNSSSGLPFGELRAELGGDN